MGLFVIFLGDLHNLNKKKNLISSLVIFTHHRRSPLNVQIEKVVTELLYFLSCFPFLGQKPKNRLVTKDYRRNQIYLEGLISCNPPILFVSDSSCFFPFNSSRPTIILCWTVTRRTATLYSELDSQVRHNTTQNIVSQRLLRILV